MAEIEDIAELGLIAEFMEKEAGIVPGQAVNDFTSVARLRRIQEALSKAAVPNAAWAQYTNLADGEVLQFDSVTNRWKNAPPSGIAALTSLKDLSDVKSTLSPTLRQFFVFDGTEWDALTPQLTDMSDVLDSMSPNPNELFRFIGSKWTSSVLNLFELDDVFVAPSGNRQVLELTAGAWASIDHTLNAINDVAISGVANRNLLQFSSGSSEFVNRTIAAAGLIDRDGSIALTGAWNAGQQITVPTLAIDATIDHIITDSTDDLTITNANADKDIVLAINQTGAGAISMMRLDGSDPSLRITNSGSVNITGAGLIHIDGTWGRTATYGIMRFNPTIDNIGASIGFFVDPLYTSANTHEGFRYQPSFDASRTPNITGFNFLPANIAVTASQTLVGYKAIVNKILTGVGAWTYTAFQYHGVALTTAGTLVDTGISLLGGGNLIAGSLTQYGIRLQGYATGVAGNVWAIHSNGGTLAWAGDNAEIRMGAGEDTRMYYDATNYIIDPDVVGSGRVLIGATGDDDMLLNDIEIDGILNHDGASIGFFAVVPVARATAYTQTFATASKTHAILTAATLTDSTGGVKDDTVAAIPVVGGSGATTAQEGVIDDNFAELTEEINALRVDLNNVKEVLNAVIDDHQAYGLFQ